MRRTLTLLALLSLTLAIGCENSGPLTTEPARDVVALQPVAGETVPLDPPTASMKVIVERNGITAWLLSKKDKPGRYGCRIKSATQQIRLKLEFSRTRAGDNGGTQPLVYTLGSVPSQKAAENWMPGKPRHEFLVARCWIPDSRPAIEATLKLVKRSLHKVYSDVYIYQADMRAGMSMVRNDSLAGCPPAHTRTRWSTTVCTLGGVTIGAPGGRRNPPPLDDPGLPPAPDVPWDPWNFPSGGSDDRRTDNPDDGTYTCVLPDGSTTREPVELAYSQFDNVIVGDSLDTSQGSWGYNPPCSDKTVREWRLENIADFLRDCPAALLKENGVDYVRLARHKASKRVIRHLKALPALHTPGGLSQRAFIQTLENASGPLAHVDEFTIRFRASDLPRGMSAQGFFNHWRKNIADYVDPALSRFSPYNKRETRRWRSSDPLGTVFHIDLMAFGVPWIEDGSVVTTGYTGKKWIFSTAWTPRDFRHPLSGQRSFWYQKRNGWVTMGTRSVTRMTAYDYKLGNFLTKVWMEGGLTFSQAKKAWKSLQKRTAKKLAELGVDAQIIKPRIGGFDYDLLKAAVNGKRALSCRR